MPTYDYECENCQYTFDELQSFKDPPLKTCPKCQQDSLRRLFGTGAAILFKGSGFYETDYRSESYKKAAKADQDATGKGGDKSTGASKSESNGSATPAATESKKSETKSSPPTP